MTLLRPERERSEVIDFRRGHAYSDRCVPNCPNPQHTVELHYLRKQAPRKHAGQFALMARGPIFPVLRRWRPDNLKDKFTGWLWPRFREVVAWLFCIAVGLILALAFAWRPWE